MNQKTIAIFGATSAIAKEYGRIRSAKSDSLILIGRNPEKLSEIKNDLIARGAKSAKTISYDFNDLAGLQNLIGEVFQEKIDVALIAFGTLPNQQKCKNDFDYMLKHYSLNAISTISILSLIAEKMKLQKHGTIATITSVAGDRGKKSNYYYGAAKSSVSTFLQGIRQDLYQSNVNVLDIKPGFVDTPMTNTFTKGFLWSQPNKIALGINRAIQLKKNTVYLPFYWKWIMCLIKNIPESIFKKMNL